MSTRLITLIVSWCVEMSGVALGGFFIGRMRAGINRKRQEGDQIPYLGFTLRRMLMIFREYRALYPTGKLHIYALEGIGLVFIGFTGMAVCLLWTGGGPR